MIILQIKKMNRLVDFAELNDVKFEKSFIGWVAYIEGGDNNLKLDGVSFKNKNNKWVSRHDELTGYGASKSDAIRDLIKKFLRSKFNLCVNPVPKYTQLTIEYE